MILLKRRTDILGAMASLLCFVHCIATPFIFLAQACTSSCCQTAPYWWQFIDYIFLVISVIAVQRSVQSTSIPWMKPLLWISWVGLLLVLLNEKVALLNLPMNTNYIPAFALIILHLYNHKYCQCPDEHCSAKNARPLLKSLSKQYKTK